MRLNILVVGQTYERTRTYGRMDVRTDRWTGNILGIICSNGRTRGVTEHG